MNLNLKKTKSQEIKLDGNYRAYLFSKYNLGTYDH